MYTLSLIHILELYMDAMDVTDENVYCDKTRLNQILLNLLRCV